MLQNIYLETDNMTQFIAIVRAAIKTTFELPPGKYSQLYLTTRQNYMFRDGKKWIGNNKDLLDKLGVKSLSATDERGWSKPKRFFICTIADYRTEMEKDNQAIPFNSYDLLMERICVLLQDNPNHKIGSKTKFNQLCGSGYHYGFNEHDGDIDMGYCCQYRPNGGWNNLDISLCHVYYGK
jgi:hypothetical protein